MPRHDVAIYMPNAAGFYDATWVEVGGGAERQTFLLAEALTRHGLDVAHVTYPVAIRREDSPPVTLIHQPPPTDRGTADAFVRQARQLWRSLSVADARVVVFRGASGALGTGALWCRAHRRRLVFASANEADFRNGPFASSRDPRAIAYATGRRLADQVVVQSAVQATMAHERLPGRPVEQIASFVEPQPATELPGEAFLWISRLVDYKRPMAYLDLAAAVPEATFWMLANASQTDAEEALREQVVARAAEIPNLQLVAQRPHPELQELMGRAIATVNTSEVEGVPNIWLEGWARGIPALTLSFDPDGRVARNGLGISAGGDWDAFVAGARRLWAARENRDGLGPAVRGYVGEAHGSGVERAWLDVVDRLRAPRRGARARG